MDTTVAANPGESAGSQSAEPSTALDNPSNLDFWEPGDEPANPGSGTDGIAQANEPAETNDGQEAEAGTEEVDSDDGKPVVSDDYELDLGDEKITIKELKLRGLRERDYRFKTDTVSRERGQVQERAARLDQSVNALVDLLAADIPAEPDPALLWSNNPADHAQYSRQKAMHEAALGRLNTVLRHGQEAKAVNAELNHAEMQERRVLAAEVLAQDFPEIRDPAKGKAFFAAAYEAAQKAGFSQQELQLYTDPRAFKMAYWASKGMQAEQAKAKAQQKVQNVPPVQAPQKGKPSPNASADRRNREAMAALRKSSSKADALKVDFD